MRIVPAVEAEIRREIHDARAIDPLIPHMRTDIADPLRDQKNRARIIEKAFDGADEYATDFGVLRRKAGPGTKGTLFFLAPPQPPQNGV
jgi:hypothetical protein